MTMTTVFPRTLSAVSDGRHRPVGTDRREGHNRNYGAGGPADPGADSALQPAADTGAGHLLHGLAGSD
jgi:hypothetical protein